MIVELPEEEDKDLSQDIDYKKWGQKEMLEAAARIIEQHKETLKNLS